jgi:L-aspartate oxidase
MEKASEKDRKITRSATDYVIVGSGVAGIFTALRLAETGRVTLLSKQDLIAGNTWFAQGGIAAAFSPEDSPTLHFEDTWKAGNYFGDRAAISVLAEEAPARINDLLNLGVRFDRSNGAIALGREGAHSMKRILHIGGDATGRELIESLIHTAKETGIHFIEDAFAEHIAVEDGRCRGLFYSTKEGLNYIAARAVILATGGCGQLFQFTTNAPAVTGDGLGMAYKAGAILRDLEFFQFHPTVFLPPEGQPFLISEAVRGEGAYLVNAKGERFMLKKHERAELGPRDVVSRAIVEEQRRTKDFVYLDLRHLGADFIPERFPTIYSRCLEWKLDITKDLIPVTPAAHYLIGGVEVDLDGHTAVKNLYCVGEVASTGVHGANRLASNSLLEGLVFGHRVAVAAAQNTDQVSDELPEKPLAYFSRPADQGAEEECAVLRRDLTWLMWHKVGLIRTEESMLEMKRELEKWLPLISYRYHTPELNETANMLLAAMMMTEAALLRRESRGSHYRTDYPESDDKLAGQQITFCVVEGAGEENQLPRAVLSDKPGDGQKE